MRLTSNSILLLQLAGTALALPAETATDRHGGAPRPNHARAHAVKQAFEKSWQGYYKNAFPHDTLQPISNGYEDDRCVPVYVQRENIVSDECDETETAGE
jgi:hypothetical protein